MTKILNAVRHLAHHRQFAARRAWYAPLQSMAFHQWQLKTLQCVPADILLMLTTTRSISRPSGSVRWIFSAGSSPSNHESTALTLASRRVTLKSILQRHPREFEKVWANISERLGGSGLMSAENALQILRKPLTTEYKNETDFSKALFAALRLCLSSHELQKPNPDVNTILLKVGNAGNTFEYAVGLVRQYDVAVDLLGDLPEKGAVPVHTGTISISGMKESAIPDHAVCLFQRDRHSTSAEWMVKDCFAVVELKMNDTSCQHLRFVDGEVKAVLLENQHGALGQVILYTMGGVLPYHARRGVLGDHLPLAIIAGKKSKSDSSDLTTTLSEPSKTNKQITKPGRLRWVSGRLDIPEACGQQFHYGVEDFGHFFNNSGGEEEEKEKEDASVRNAISLYLDTLLFGITHAISVQNSLATNVVPPPVPSSGRSLMVGDIKLDVRLCASPIHGANPFVEVPNNGEESWSVSQGEIFKGRLKINQVLEGSKPRARFHFFNDDDNVSKEQELDVVVKVSSLAVHKIFTNPYKNLLALSSIKGSNFFKEIGTVLYLVAKQEAGLVTIMADLSKQGFKLLKPRKCRDKLAVLWIGYQDLVKNVLLPMAEEDVVHPDIRPGFDITSNVLCKFNGDDRAVLKLIDYESLLLFDDWDAPTDDGRYIRREGIKDATAFVWWQSVFLAYVWHHELDANDVRQGDHFNAMMRDYYNSNGIRTMTWWKEFEDDNDGNTSADYKMDAECVRKTVARLGKMFETSSSTSF